MLSVEACYRQTDDAVAGVGYALHFHPSFGTDKQDFCFGAQFTDGVGNGYGREDMTSRTASADDDTRMVMIVVLLHIFTLLYMCLFEFTVTVQKLGGWFFGFLTGRRLFGCCLVARFYLHGDLCVMQALFLQLAVYRLTLSIMPM